MKAEHMTKDQLIEAIWAVVAAKPAANTAGALVVEKIAERMDALAIGEAEAIEKMASKGIVYGSNGEFGGVNIYCDEAGEFTRHEFTSVGDATWVTLGDLIDMHASDSTSPDWFESEWMLVEGTSSGFGPRTWGDVSSATR